MKTMFYFVQYNWIAITVVVGVTAYLVAGFYLVVRHRLAEIGIVLINSVSNELIGATNENFGMNIPKFSQKSKKSPNGFRWFVWDVVRWPRLLF